MNPGNLGDLGNLDTQTLLQHLPGVRFPAEKEQVAATAERNDAPQELVERIRNADTQRFNGPDEVLQVVQEGRQEEEGGEPRSGAVLRGTQRAGCKSPVFFMLGANFRELRYGEVRRIPLPRTPVNRMLPVDLA